MSDCTEGIRLELRTFTDIHRFVYINCLNHNLLNMVRCRSFATTFCSDYCCIFCTLSFYLSIDCITISDCIEEIRLELRNVTDIHRFVYINCLTRIFSLCLDTEAVILTYVATVVVYLELYPSTCLLIVSR